eukprot:668276-Pleurochrysis_carterae.AAC.8
MSWDDNDADCKSVLRVCRFEYEYADSNSRHIGPNRHIRTRVMDMWTVSSSCWGGYGTFEKRLAIEQGRMLSLALMRLFEHVLMQNGFTSHRKVAKRCRGRKKIRQMLQQEAYLAVG